MLRHEIEDEARNLVVLFVHCEMARVQQVDFSVGQIALERLAARRRERRIICTPRDQRGRLVIAQPRLPFWIGGYIGAIIIEKV
jgi:hypothetical protein